MEKSILIIVESPTKARTIKKFLGKQCQVIACMGHIRDLPRKAAEIPPEAKKKPWASLGINVKDNFAPLYIVPPQKNKILAEIRKAIKVADMLYLATDEDREGESISWHLVDLLKPKIPVKRMVFHEITAKAIQHAFETPRELNMQLVHAQEARRILDRLVGYTLSPLIWKKIAYGLSAGRVQSVVLRILVELEKKRMLFQKASYWGVLAELEKEGTSFEAKLVEAGGKKVAIGKDFNENTGKLKDGKEKNTFVFNEEQAKSLQKQISQEKWTVSAVEEKPISRKPAPPLITSTLQQEAGRKLGLSARDTMRIAQSLYEKGFITYMRTDSVTLSQSAISKARECVQQLFGKNYLSSTPRIFHSKSKGAQEAHEAIRPSLEFTPPSQMKLSGKDLALYELIWMRTVASQMAEARQLQVSASICVPYNEGGEKSTARFHASGMKIVFPGFLKAYVEGEDDPGIALANRERFLPNLEKGTVVGYKDAKPTQHETKPPARFTEASIIALMEKEGIGRPSTYASMVSTIVDRGYANKQGSTLIPTFTSLVVTNLMCNHFEKFVDFDFTSTMEESLDDIAHGKLEYTPYLKEFYLGKNGLEALVKRKEVEIEPEKSRCLEFKHLENILVRVGKYGPYFEYTDPKTKEVTKASVPAEIAPADLNKDCIDKIVRQVKAGPQSLAVDPETKKSIFLRTGTYGPYLQLGDLPDETTGKLKRVSVPKGTDPETLTAEDAILLIQLPRKLGQHPETGNDIITNIGRFGPYVQHVKDYRSLKKEDSVFTINFARAMELFSAPKSSRGRKKILREVGEHPKSKEAIIIYDGPYGPYIKYGKANVTVPSEKDPQKITIEECVALVEEKNPTPKTKTAAKAPKRKAKKSARKSAAQRNNPTPSTKTKIIYRKKAKSRLGSKA